MEQQSPVGRTGMVTTTIPVGGMGEVRVAIGGGTTTYGAYGADRDVPVPTGTRVNEVELFPPHTVIVEPAMQTSPQDTPGWTPIEW